MLNVLYQSLLAVRRYRASIDSLSYRDSNPFHSGAPTGHWPPGNLEDWLRVIKLRRNPLPFGSSSSNWLGFSFERERTNLVIGVLNRHQWFTISSSFWCNSPPAQLEVSWSSQTSWTQTGINPFVWTNHHTKPRNN